MEGSARARTYLLLASGPEPARWLMQRQPTAHSPQPTAHSPQPTTHFAPRMSVFAVMTELSKTCRTKLTRRIGGVEGRYTSALGGSERVPSPRGCLCSA
jgi:hypothetical protein